MGLVWIKKKAKTKTKTVQVHLLSYQSGHVYVRVYLACVASVSSRVLARKLEREQKKKMEGVGGGEKRKRLPANPTILENAPWYFTVRFICKLTARQDR